MRLGGFARHVFFIFLQFEDVLSTVLSIFVMFDGTLKIHTSRGSFAKLGYL